MRFTFLEKSSSGKTTTTASYFQLRKIHTQVVALNWANAVYSCDLVANLDQTFTYDDANTDTSVSEQSSKALLEAR